MKKIDTSDVSTDLERLYRKVDAKVKKYGPLSDEDISGIIKVSRARRRAS